MAPTAVQCGVHPSVGGPYEILEFDAVSGINGILWWCEMAVLKSSFGLLLIIMSASRSPELRVADMTSPLLEKTNKSSVHALVSCRPLWISRCQGKFLPAYGGLKARFFEAFTAATATLCLLSSVNVCSFLQHNSQVSKEPFRPLVLVFTEFCLRRSPRSNHRR
jgi:hypothetical protein